MNNIVLYIVYDTMSCSFSCSLEEKADKFNYNFRDNIIIYYSLIYQKIIDPLIYFNLSTY